MKPTKQTSKKLYDSMDDIEIEALGKTWNSEEFKGLFRYDVLKILSFVYLFSDRGERRQIESNVAELFGLKNAKRELVSIIEEFNARNVVSGLLLNMPYSLAVVYLQNSDEGSEIDVDTVLMSIVHCCFSCMDIGDSVISGIRLAIPILFYECCLMRLKNEGLSDNESLIDSPENIGTLVEKQEISEYEEVSSSNDNTLKKTYDRLKTFFAGEEFLQLMDECSGKSIEINYTRKNIQTICDKMNDPYKDMSISEMMDDLMSRLRGVGIDLENSSENNMEEDEDEEDIDEEEWIEEDDYDCTKSETEAIEAQFSRLEDRESELREIYGEDCELRIAREGVYSDIQFTGPILECLRKASELLAGERYNDQFIIFHRVNQDESYRIPHPFYGIRSALYAIERKLDEKGREESNLTDTVPFDSSILPAEYPHFDELEVNDTNFDLLWKNLKRIENKYRKGLVDYRDDDYMYASGVNDWESECCYEQAKYLENIRWNGGKPAFENCSVSYTTIRKFNKKQLRYYLYWRSQLFDGRWVRPSDSYLFMCMYELLAGIGNFTEEERIENLSRLTKPSNDDYGYFIGKCKTAILEYQRIFNLVDSKSLFSGDVTTWTHEWECCAKEISTGDYTHIFEVINYQASYHMYSGALNTRIPCADHMIQCIKSLISPLHDLYTKHGLSFEKTLVGNVAPYTKNRISNAVIWTDRVQNRLYGNQKSDCVNFNIKNNPLAISDYLVKSVENAFRTFFKTGAQLKLTRIEDYEGNPQRYWYYIENQTKEERDERRKYIAVFDELDDVIRAGIEEYFKLHDEELNELRKEYVPEKPITVSQPIYSFEKKTPVDEEMIKFISDATDDDGLVDKLLEIYDKASPSTKKSKAKKFRNWIWDFWILHRSAIPYDELCERVTDNRWRIEEFIAIQSRDYVNAIPYLQSIHNICNGVVTKTIEKSVIADTVIVVFACLDGLFASYGIDFSEMILGRFKEEKWIPYNTDDGIQNNAGQSFVKNLGNVEIYIYDGENHEGRIKHYEESDEARDFTAYILKLIDNHFRAKIGSKTFLKNEYDNSQLQILVDNQTAFSFVEEVVSRVVGYFVDCSTGKYDFDAAITKNITLTDSSERDYVFAGCNDNNSIEQLVERNIKQYLGISDLVRTSNSALYDSVELDLENFNFDDWTNRYMDRKKVLHKLPYINIYRFYDIFPELVNRIDRVRGITADYDPYYNFVISKVMKAQSGLINKDLNALKFLGDDGQDFAQWITWINHGRFVFPKNEPFVQIFFHFAFNDWVLPDNRKACLVIMSQIWNYYFADYTLRDTASDLYLEWIKDYWMVNCDDVSYSDFKSLFKCDVEFANEKGVQSSKDHFFVDISTLDEYDLLSFYNANCDYRVKDGSVVASRYGNLLEEALEAVHVGLKKLWAQYGLDFIDYLHYNDENIIVKERELYYRAILTGTTKRKLIDNFKGRKISECEEYSCRYDYDRAWPILVCKLKEISNSSSRVLLEYILKLTEKVVREWLSIPYGFKFDEERLYELFPCRLFDINAKNHIIESVITEIVLRVCEESGIQSKNAKIRAVLETDESNDASNNTTTDEDRRERMQQLYNIVSGRKDEYDPIERDQRVDSSSIEGAREVLRRNQNRLIVEEENAEHKDSQSDDFAGVFSSEEEELLKILLSGDSVAERIEEMKQRFLAPNLLVESINEKAIDIIGDTVIEGYDSYELVEDYIDDVEKLISGRNESIG